MGRTTPKSKKILEELENVVKDAVVSGSDDPVLEHLIELTITSLLEGRPLYQNILEEPDFYRRYFKKWVKEGLREHEAMEKIKNKPFENIKLG